MWSRKFIIMLGLGMAHARIKEPIGGWLILPAIGTFLAPLRHLAELGKSAGDYENIFAGSNVALHYFAVFEIAVMIGLTAAWVTGIVLLVKRSPQFPVLFNALLIASVLFFIAELIVLNSYFGVALGPEEFGRLAGFVVVTSIWVPYMAFSARVQRTFRYAAYVLPRVSEPNFDVANQPQSVANAHMP